MNFGETSVFHYRIAGNNGVDILCVTSYFLLDLPRLEDSFSFLKTGVGWGEGWEEERKICFRKIQKTD